MKKTQIEIFCELAKRLGMNTMADIQKFKEERNIKTCTLDRLISMLEFELQEREQKEITR